VDRSAIQAALEESKAAITPAALDTAPSTTAREMTTARKIVGDAVAAVRN
jgi:hypothetical protein